MSRILHFVSTPAIWSGVMSVIMNYYRHMDRTLVQFDFLCFLHCENSYEDEITSYGGHVYYVKKPGSSMASVREMEKFFKEHEGRYQWFHNHEVYLSFYLWRLVGRYDYGHFAIHSHATRYSDKWLNARRNQLLCYPILFMKCNRIACSRAAGSFLFGEKMVQQNKVYILYNAIDCKKYRYNREKREKLRYLLGVQDKLVIGHVGRFEKQKNHEFLIESFSILKKQCPESVLILIGSGSLKMVMEQKVKDAGLEDTVFFLGQQNNNQDWYQAMDLFWLPSVYEGLPMAAVEAQASGLPCFLADSITQEVELLDTTKRLSLKKGPEYWAAEACKLYNTLKRDDAWRMVENAGFGIESSSIALQRYYMNEGAE
ncbi:glycosyltransferase [Lacrimispora celerecrescens]|uniref:glycosyltransferase n=1 Tax=Lacrimispora celerecrescens TaxID=29354 RepID=UPI001646F579|nr:glycosyltransferase [Lacrimispora celerecrescens]